MYFAIKLPLLFPSFALCFCSLQCTRVFPPFFNELHAFRQIVQQPKVLPRFLNKLSTFYACFPLLFHSLCLRCYFCEPFFRIPVVLDSVFDRFPHTHCFCLCATSSTFFTHCCIILVLSELEYSHFFAYLNDFFLPCLCALLAAHVPVSISPSFFVLVLLKVTAPFFLLKSFSSFSLIPTSVFFTISYMLVIFSISHAKASQNSPLHTFHKKNFLVLLNLRSAMLPFSRTITTHPLAVMYYVLHVAPLTTLFLGFDHLAALLRCLAVMFHTSSISSHPDLSALLSSVAFRFSLLFTLPLRLARFIVPLLVFSLRIVQHSCHSVYFFNLPEVSDNSNITVSSLLTLYLTSTSLLTFSSLFNFFHCFLSFTASASASLFLLACVLLPAFFSTRAHVHPFPSAVTWQRCPHTSQANSIASCHPLACQHDVSLFLPACFFGCSWCFFLPMGFEHCHSSLPCLLTSVSCHVPISTLACTFASCFHTFS